jgi:hypothetical protein
MCIKLVIEKLIDIMMHGHRNIKAVNTVYSYLGARGFEPRLGETSSVYFHNTSQYIQASKCLSSSTRKALLKCNHS